MRVDGRGGGINISFRELRAWRHDCPNSNHFLFLFNQMTDSSQEKPEYISAESSKQVLCRSSGRNLAIAIAVELPTTIYVIEPMC